MYFPEILTGLIIVAVALIVLVFLRYVPLGLWSGRGHPVCR